jgi:hypothetical protein
VPLTPSHVAAVLPLRAFARRHAVPFSAFVIGAMSPDFEYLLRLYPGGGFGHSLRGLVLFCVPVGLVVLLAFRVIVAPALIRVTPPGLVAALDLQGDPLPHGVRWWGGAALAILAGAATHAIWDSFTHWNGWSVRHLPVLRRPVAHAVFPRFRWYALLQHGGTLVGGLAVIGSLIMWVRSQPSAARRFAPAQKACAVRILLFLVMTSALGAVLNAARGTPRGLTGIVSLGAVGSMSALAIGLFIVGLADAVQHGTRS